MLNYSLMGIWEQIAMARGAKGKSGPVYSQQQATWVNVSLDADQRSAIKEWELDSDSLETTVMELLAEGYRLSLSYEKDSDSISAFLFDRRTDSKTNNWALTARAPSIFFALKVMVFKHIVVLQRDWAKYKTERPDEDFS